MMNNQSLILLCLTAQGISRAEVVLLTGHIPTGPEGSQTGEWMNVDGSCATDPVLGSRLIAFLALHVM